MMDDTKNREATGTETDISMFGSRVRVLVVPTNEVLVIARDTRRIVEAEQP